MSQNRLFVGAFLFLIFTLSSTPASGAKIDMMSDASMIAFLSQSLGGDGALAAIAWEGMDSGERQKVRSDATRLLKMAAEANKKYGVKPDITYQFEWFKASLLAEIYVSEAAKSADLSEEALRNFHEKNKDMYSTGARVNFRQIVCASETDAKKVYSLACSPITSFETIARAASVDPTSAMNGGGMGWIAREKLDSSFARKLFEAELNRVYPPVKVGESWIVFEVLKKDAGKVRPFEQVREIVRIDLFNSIMNL